MTADGATRLQGAQTAWCVWPASDATRFKLLGNTMAGCVIVRLVARLAPKASPALAIRDTWAAGDDQEGLRAEATAHARGPRQATLAQCWRGRGSAAKRTRLPTAPPAGLPNNGNCCYANAAIQACLCCGELAARAAVHPQGAGDGWLGALGGILSRATQPADIRDYPTILDGWRRDRNHAESYDFQMHIIGGLDRGGFGADICRVG